MKNYTDLVIADTSGLYSPYTAPEEARHRVHDAWYRLFEESGLTVRAGEMDKDHQDSDGRWILGWFVGEDEYYYYVIFDQAQNKVAAERRQKAVRTDG